MLLLNKKKTICTFVFQLGLCTTTYLPSCCPYADILRLAWLILFFLQDDKIKKTILWYCTWMLQIKHDKVQLQTTLNHVQFLPIPEDPRKRNTRGCSSSYQPFSLLRIAEKDSPLEFLFSLTKLDVLTYFWVAFGHTTNDFTVVADPHLHKRILDKLTWIIFFNTDQLHGTTLNILTKFGFMHVSLKIDPKPHLCKIQL